MQTRVFHSIEQCGADEWDALSDGANPFVSHAFLHALEASGSVSDSSGWRPSLITLSDSQGLAAAAPAYLKMHSYGEFVFDFSWAQAYARAGLDYYPKLTIAAPFTPAGGPRLLVRADLPPAQTRAALSAAIVDFVDARQLSSAHALFTSEVDQAALETEGWLARRDCQFHWRNRGYQSFDDFLGEFTADKRKKAKRERRRVAESGIHFETRAGHELSDAELAAMYALHRDTFVRHGHEPYLTLAFFEIARRSFGHQLMVKFAMFGQRVVAVAIFFVGRETLYGRYWGAAADFHSLHFETCYHQGVEYCIEHGLARFEPGTQGEHKVSRGFEPTTTTSAHWIREPRFRAAIADYLRRESRSVDEYSAAVERHVPFREESRER